MTGATATATATAIAVTPASGQPPLPLTQLFKFCCT